MSSVSGWRIQVTPQFAFSTLASTFFLNVEIADEADAVNFVRNRADAKPGERIYAVRPLTTAELAKPAVSGL